MQVYVAANNGFSGEHLGRQVPVVSYIDDEDGIPDGDHYASEDEVAAYQAYWAETCPIDGLERGEHCEHQEAGEF